MNASGAFTFSGHYLHRYSGVGYDQKLQIQGKLDDNGEGGVTLYRARDTIFVTSFSVQFHSAQVPYFTCAINTIVRDDFEEYILGQAYKQSAAGSLEGKYTALLAPKSPTSTPTATERSVDGNGWVAITVNAKGKVNTVGKLSNNRPFSYSSVLRADGAFPLYTGTGQPAQQPPSKRRYDTTATYRSLDVVTGIITLTDTGSADGKGALDWLIVNPPHSNITYPSKLNAEASKFTLAVADGLSEKYSGTFSGGTLSNPEDASFTVAETTKGPKVSSFASPITKLKAPAGSGIPGTFTGSVKNLEQGGLRSFSGVFLQRQGVAGGFFLGGTGAPEESGALRFSATLNP